MSLTIAYLAGGELHLKEGQNPAQIVGSTFVQTSQERLLSLENQAGLQLKQPISGYLARSPFPARSTRGGKATGHLQSHKPLRSREGSLHSGNKVDSAKMAKKNEKLGNKDSPVLVPRSCQLIRQQPGEEPRENCKGIIFYDVGRDGLLVYTNGNAIHTIAPDGVAKRLLKTPLIEQVALIKTAQ